MKHRAWKCPNGFVLLASFYLINGYFMDAYLGMISFPLVSQGIKCFDFWIYFVIFDLGKNVSVHREYRNRYNCLSVIPQRTQYKLIEAGVSQSVQWVSLDRNAWKRPWELPENVQWGCWDSGVPPFSNDEATPELLSFPWEWRLLLPGRGGCNFPYMLGSWFSQTTPGNSCTQTQTVLSPCWQVCLPACLL